MAKIAQHNHDREELTNLRKQMSELDAKLNVEKIKLTQYTRLKRDMDEHINRMNTAKSSLEQTTFHQKLERIEALSQEITKRKSDIEAFNLELASMKEKHAQLSDKVNNGSNKEEEKQRVQKTIDEKKKFISTYLKKNSQFQQDYNLIQGEIEALQNEINTYNEELAKIDENMANIEEQKVVTNKKIADLHV